MKKHSVFPFPLAGSAVVLFTVVALVAGAFFLRSGREEPGETHSAAAARSAEKKGAGDPSPTLTPRMRTRLHEIVNDCAARDQRAVQATIGGVQGIVQEYRDRIPGFLDRIFSLKTKAVLLWKTGIVGLNRMRVRASGEGPRNYIRGIWQETMFTEEALGARIVAELASLRYQLAANRHEMASALLAEFGTMTPGVIPLAVDGDPAAAFRDALDAEILRIAAQSSAHALRGEAAALLLDAALTPVITKTLLGTFRSVGTGAVAGAAGGGGATAAGLSSGSWTFGVSIVLGVVIDAGINRYARKRTQNELDDFLDSVEERLLHGDNENEGLRPLLERGLEQYHSRLHVLTLHAVQDFIQG